MTEQENRTHWTNLAIVGGTVLQAVIAGLALWAFINSTRTNERLLQNQQAWQERVDSSNLQLLRKQQEWQEKARKGEIAPDIQLTQETTFDSTYDVATIVFENIGKNVAKDIFVWIRYGNDIMKMTRQDFHPLNGGPEQNYIHPGQKLKFSFGPAGVLGKEYSEKSVQEKFNIASSPWTIYFSYFDIDRNQYLLATTEPLTAIRGGMILHMSKDAVYLDSILFLLPNPRWAKALIEEPQLRNEYGFVRKDIRSVFDSLSKAKK